MTVLIAGASGATGRLLVRQLLQRNLHVKVIVRSQKSLPQDISDDKKTTVIQASILDLSDDEMARHVNGCDAVVSCLGHNLNFKGIYGHPRRLVTNAVHRLCDAVKKNKPDKPVKFVLMNTTGNINRDINEPVSFAQKCVLSLLRLMLPPHVDNEKAADYLRLKIGQNDEIIEWTAVRPDNLIDKTEVSTYDVYASPVRSAIFDPGVTSRINVAHFMARLITDPETWNQWKGQMPVIYNHE